LDAYSQVGRKRVEGGKSLKRVCAASEETVELVRQRDAIGFKDPIESFGVEIEQEW